MLKKMKQFLVFYIFINCYFSYAQFTVSGIVKNKANTIEYANVIITDSERMFVKGTTTDEKGIFNLEVKKGDYILTVTFIGYKEFKKQFKITKNLDLDSIYLHNNSTNLEEITMNSSKKIIERKAGKLIFNVANSEFKSGFDAVEVLKRVPSVYVDSRGGILLRNENATVIVNGRTIKLKGDSLASYLKTIDSSNIETIEVQMISSAETDANIQGGVIKFKLKKKVIGFKGVYKSYYLQQGDFPKYFGGTSFNYGSKKWNLYGSITYTDEQKESNTTTGLLFKNKNRRYDEKTKFKLNLSERIFTQFGSTFEATKNQELGFEVYALLTKSDALSISNLDVISNNTLLDNGNTNSSYLDDTNYYNAAFNYTIKLNNGGKIKLLSDFGKQQYDRNANFNTKYNLHFFDDTTEKTSTKTNTSIFSSQIDINKKTTALGTISTGVKYTSTNRNDATTTKKLEGTIFEIIDGRTTALSFTENIYAAYFSSEFTISDKVDMKIGLRVESTKLNGEETINKNKTINKHTDYFPNFVLSKSFAKKQSVVFSFNRKTKRPDFYELSPHENKMNEFYYQIGNPLLQPEYRNNFDFTYNFKRNSISIYYKYVKGIMMSTYFVVDDIAYLQYNNNGNDMILGADFNFYKAKSKKWYFKANTSYYNQKYELPIKSYNHNTFTINASLDYLLKKNWSFNLSANYFTSKLISEFVEKETFEANLMIQKKLWKKKLKLRFYIKDVFNTVRDIDKGTYEDFYTTFDRKRDTRRFIIVATYVINSKEKVRTTKNKTSNSTRKRL